MARTPKPAVPTMEWSPFVHRLPDGAKRQGHRSAVPGGWVVLLPGELGGGVFFYEDPAHRWTGEGAPEQLKKRPSRVVRLPRARGRWR